MEYYSLLALSKSIDLGSTSTPIGGLMRWSMGLFVETTDQQGQQSSDAENLIVVSLTWG